MIKVCFHDSGEVWVLSNGGITRKVIRSIFDAIRWYRAFFPDLCNEFSYAHLEIDNDPRMICGLTSTYELISLYRDGQFHDYRRFYNA